MQSQSILEEKIKRIESIFTVSKIIDRESNSTNDIQKYYRINDLAYRLFHSNKGFMHFRVSKESVLKDDDILYQVDVISKYIKNNATVLELGSGQSANIIYLAKKHLNSFFIGVVLYPKKIKNKLKRNIKIYKHDYSDLSFIEDNSIDLVYGIETLVHSSNKEKVFKEITRVLKEDGILILYGYTLKKKLKDYLPYEQTAMKIMSKTGAAALIESFDSWNKYIKNTGFTEIKTSDLHQYILPDLKRLEQKANHIMRKYIRIKICKFLLPKTFVNNIIMGWLGFDAYNEGIGYYNEWIYQKPKD